MEKNPFGSKTFWANFARRHWEKSPVAFHKADVSGADIFSLDATNVFDLLVRYCDQCRADDTTDGLKFYVDGIRLESFETLEHLPVKSDKSLHGYHRRMEAQFDDYGLVCDELMQVNDRRWGVVHTFMDSLYEHVGMPNRFCEIGLYLGNYKKTPFGIHIDKCGVLSFPIVGSKKFRLWAPKYVKAHPELQESFSYDEFKKQSIVMKVKPGDVAYWPSTYWHIAENAGSFNATWSIGVWVDKTTLDVALEALTPLFEKAITKSLGRERRKTSLRPTKTLPTELKKLSAVIAKIPPAQIENAFKAWWENHLHHRGFKKAKAMAR